jgi:hypothetical protein|tara:strand:- start:19 stop:426 length:408 start_codon:yes stop_codon:yes gene_type:complete
MICMKFTFRALWALCVILFFGCGTKVTHEADEIAVQSSIKGQIASNIVQVTDDVAEVTGKARLVAGQVSGIADNGVNAGVYVAPRVQVQWEYKVINPSAEELEVELNNLGEEGWELFSERKEDGKSSYVLKRRRS